MSTSRDRSQRTVLIGVDVGGTFTDLLWFDEVSGDIRASKVPSVPAAPDQAIYAAVEALADEASVQDVDLFLHGTTVGLNALLTGRGTPVALLTTRGHRDALEIKRGDRDDPYSVFPEPARPLVPRRLRLPVSERVLHDGTIETALNEEDVRQAAVTLASAGIESVAVAFLNAYANPANELAAERVLREAGYDGSTTLSHRVSREYREYERTSTTVVDAYVGPGTSSYLQRVAGWLRARGFSGSCLITRSGGGALTFEQAEARAHETIMSGPVAGAQGAAALATTLGLDRVVTADVGGTSFDTCLVVGGKPLVLYEGRVRGLPLQTQWVDVRSIGAGGGSIAYVDEGGLLRVGPLSAGADPGPACYGRGGVEPTVTDAALFLGMLGPGRLANGMQLDPQRSRAALTPLADRLRLSLDEAARGVIRIATSQMANAIREITVEQGQDPRDTALMAYGGAGPLFAGLLGRELEITTIVLPPVAGNFSAYGLLHSDIVQSAARTQLVRLSGDDAITAVNDRVAELLATLEPSDLAVGSSAGEDESVDVTLEMRYGGQEHTLAIGVPGSSHQIGLNRDQLAELFTESYQRTFGVTLDEPVEVVTVRVALRRRLRDPGWRGSIGGAPPRTSKLTALGDDPPEIEAYSFERSEVEAFKLVSRADLTVDQHLLGPAIIVEETATTYLDAGFAARVDATGAILITATDGSRGR